MDIVTHGFMGVLVGRALPEGGKRPLLAAALIGALAPDLDFAARLWDPVSAIAVHRTMTHSLFGGVMVAGLVAGLVSRFTTESFFRLFIFAYLGVLSHMVLDVLTPFGTAVLWPLSGRRFSMTLHHVIDPLFSALVLGFVIASYRLSSRRIFFARTGIAAIALFVFVATVSQRAALSHWQEFIRSQGIEPVRSTVIPLFPGPIRWLGVSETKEAFYQQPFWLHGSPSELARIYPKTNVDVPELERLREVQLFLNFARYPWSQIWREDTFRVVEYQELAFADHPLGGPLSLKIWLDESNNVKRVEFGHLF